ncbi:MAG: ATP synthase F1 subunit delta [Bacteroidota bacterium]|jgi:F-type H+-transporting ATPase subunit delta
MSEHRVASRYAKSLLDLAKEQNIVDAVVADIRTLAAVLKENRNLESVLKSPIITGERKLTVLTKIFEGSFQKITIVFFDVVIRKKRERYLPAMIKAFIEQYNELNNIAEATVKTATPVSNEILAEIKGHIEKQTGKTINLTATTDASLIGGLVVQVGDRLFDASVSGKLNKIKNDLLNSYISK